MPEWIDAYKRTPLKYGQYFVKLNGRKEIIRQEEFDKFKERYDDFFWLDDQAVSEQPKQESLLSAFKSDRLNEQHLKSLTNLFGVKKNKEFKRIIGRQQ